MYYDQYIVPHRQAHSAEYIFEYEQGIFVSTFEPTPKNIIYIDGYPEGSRTLDDPELEVCVNHTADHCAGYHAGYNAPVGDIIPRPRPTSMK